MKPFGTVRVNGMELEVGLSLDSKRVVAVANGVDLTLFSVINKVNSQGGTDFEIVPDQQNAGVANLCMKDPNWGKITVSIVNDLGASNQRATNK
jgi:hypothetical protein